MDDAQAAGRSARAGDENGEVRLPTKKRMACLCRVIGWVSGGHFKSFCVDHHRCGWPGPRQQLANNRRAESFQPICRQPAIPA